MNTKKIKSTSRIRFDWLDGFSLNVITGVGKKIGLKLNTVLCKGMIDGKKVENSFDRRQVSAKCWTCLFTRFWAVL